jgi:F420-0:gamma-glutamyl ligase
MISGTISRGLKCPIIKKGDNLEKIAIDALETLHKEEHVEFHDRDVLCLTEAIVARSQGNYATLDDISKDVRTKVGSGTIGLIFPIMSRNRFSMILKGISKGVDKLVIMMSFPADEEGNKLTSPATIYEKGVSTGALYTEKEFKGLVGETKHEFTGVDYLEYYRQIAPNSEIILSNNPLDILKYTDKVIVASIHERAYQKDILKKHGAKVVLGIDEILNASVNGSGYNPKYGLLGSNLANENTLKLFPREGQDLVEKIQDDLLKEFGVKFEVMVYGDGAFKDPQGGIWELADPVVSPFYTSGLVGTPNELKIKYLADNKFKNASGTELAEDIKEEIRHKKKNLVGQMESQGTTPRRYTDLLGSLADLTSGSGDKGTPIVLIQNYFKNYAD